jgi:hypothetical protein
MLPAEFRGAARLLQRRLAETDNQVDIALRALRPIKERLARYPRKPLRPETLIDAKRIWQREMPAFGSLARFCKIEDRSRPMFYELRLGAARFGRDGWSASTDGMLITLIGASVANGKLTVRAVIISTVGMHALARRYERGRRDDASVFDDLSTLAFNYPDLIETADRWNCYVGDGTWTGYPAMAGRDAALNVTTFLGETMPVLPAGPVADLESLIAGMPSMRFHEGGCLKRRAAVETPHPGP